MNKETIEGNIRDRLSRALKLMNGEDVLTSMANTILFQSNNAKDFVWGSVKALHKEGVFRELFDSKWKKRWYNNYILINDCYVACTTPDGTDGDTIGMYDDEFLNDNFRVDGGILDVKKFAKAVNDVYADRYKVVIEEDNFKLIKLQNKKQITPIVEVPAMTSQDYQYMAAIKTKPFLILGGFSGTGKSIAVKSLAFATCPCDGYLNASETTPGNYLLLSVKPNWHDATEITGFRSSVNHNYYVTDFMKFVIKAKMYEDQNVPFFVCLDEMNLAPVEEYFADFLSVIESRTKRQDGRIVTDALISKSVFNDSNYADDFNIFLELGIHPTIEVNDLTEFNAQLKASEEEAFYQEQWLVDELKEHGMTIPQNLIVIGTVNMDDTTNSFSRKVIDRAMTFETVVGEFDVDDYFADGSGILMEYCQKPSKGELYISDEVRATDLDSNYLNDKEKKQIIDFINNINKDLDGTPFQISYRILNETILLYRSKKEIDHIIGSGFELGVEFSLDLNDIFDDILMQKILPRIEGDYDKCHTAIENLSRRAKDSEWKRSIDKLAFMERRFGPDKSGFTSFWN